MRITQVGGYVTVFSALAYALLPVHHCVPNKQWSWQSISQIQFMEDNIW